MFSLRRFPVRRVLASAALGLAVAVAVPAVGRADYTDPEWLDPADPSVISEPGAEIPQPGAGIEQPGAGDEADTAPFADTATGTAWLEESWSERRSDHAALAGSDNQAEVADLAAAAAVPAYVPVAPARLLDTRIGVGAPTAPVGPGGTITLAVAGRGGVPASGVDAVVLNVTGVTPSSATFVTVWPSGTARPLASNLNLFANQIRPNLVMAKLGADGAVQMYNSFGSINLVADVMGYFPTGSGYNALPPARILDTRDGTGGVPIRTLAANQSLQLKVTGAGGVPASGASAVVLNLTALSSSATFVTAWPSGLGTRPEASNLNLNANDIRPNLVVVKVGSGGMISIFNQAGSTHLVADVMGWFTETGAGLGYTPLTPARILDTRFGTGVAQPGPVREDEGIYFKVTGEGGVPPSGVGAVILNVTGTEPTTGGFITGFPGALRRPCTSNLNLEPGLTAPNLVVVAVGADGYAALYNSSGDTHLIADVAGWFPSSSLAPTGGDWCGAVYRMYVRPDTFSSNRPMGRTVVSKDFSGYAVVSEDSTIVPGDTNDAADIFMIRPSSTGVTRTRVSVSSAGAQANGASSQPRVSHDGRYVVFTSTASNLVPADTNGVADVFVRDTVAGTTALVSLSTGAGVPDGASSDPQISADSRWVAFLSSASNIVAGDTNGVADVFVHDRGTQTTRRVSVSSTSAQGSAPSGPPGLSGDGGVVAFNTTNALVAADTNNADDVYRFDLNTGVLSRVSLGLGGAQGTSASPPTRYLPPSVSTTGEAIAFHSQLSGLAPAPAAGGEVYLWYPAANGAQLVPHRLPTIDSFALAADDSRTVVVGSSDGLPWSQSNNTAVDVTDLVTGQRGVVSPAAVTGATCSYGDVGISASGFTVSYTRRCFVNSLGFNLWDALRWYS